MSESEDKRLEEMAEALTASLIPAGQMFTHGHPTFQRILESLRHVQREERERPAFVRYEVVHCEAPKDGKPSRYHIYGLTAEGIRVGLDKLYLREHDVALEAAEARLREVEAERDELRANALELGKIIDQHYAEILALRAEVARLKAPRMETVAMCAHLKERAEKAEAALQELRDILSTGSNPEREDGECCRCGEPYNVRPGCDYSPECDACAQVVVGNARAALGEKGQP